MPTHAGLLHLSFFAHATAQVPSTTQHAQQRRKSPTTVSSLRPRLAPLLSLEALPA